MADAGIGMTMWVLGAVFTGVSQNYGSLMFARIFMGAGATMLACTLSAFCLCVCSFVPKSCREQPTWIGLRDALQGRRL